MPVGIVVPHAVYFFHDVFYLPIGFICKYSIILLQAATKEKSYCLVNTGSYTALILFYYFIAIVTGLPVDEFHQYLSLVYGEIGKRIRELLLQFFFS